MVKKKIHSHKLDSDCPKCGKRSLVCEVTDMGGPDYYLDYVHQCKNDECKHLVGTAEQVCWSGSPDLSAFRCPLCGYDYCISFGV